VKGFTDKAIYAQISAPFEADDEEEVNDKEGEEVADARA
jgi:hypothetical protein